MKLINDCHLMNITPRSDIVMVRGQGSYLWDSLGRRYLDFMQGWAVNALGHAPPELHAALSHQAELLVTPSPAFHNAPQLELAQRLAELSGLDEVHFSNSGAEANEVAIKLARKWGKVKKNGAYEVITTHDAFHGRTLAMMAASGKPGWNQLFPPLPDGFRKVCYGDVSAVAAAITPHTAAVMVEPIQGEAGVVVPPDGYLRDLRQLADERNILLILDEVQTGMGRTGTVLSYQYDRIIPDVLTLGKGLGAGYPISATLARKHASCFEFGDQGGTFNGSPLGTAVANAIVGVIAQREFLEHVLEMGAYLEQRLHQLKELWSETRVRGRGLLWAMELGCNRAEEIRDSALRHGLIVNAARPSVLRFSPSLRVTRDEVDAAVECLKQALLATLPAGRSFSLHSA
jgi:acetylornithine/N-succinyldiaminopimelate aminotransferase